MKPNSSRLIRTCLIISILAGITVTTTGVINLRGRIVRLQTSLKAQTAAREDVQRQLAQTKASLDRSMATLNEVTASLEKSKTEHDRAQAEAEAQATRVAKLSRDLKEMRHERDERKSELASYTNTGMNSQQVAKVAATLKELRESLALANTEKAVLTQNLRRLAAEAGTDGPVTLPPGLITKVNVADPKWGFVILDAGSEKGMLPRAELLISRDGKLVGKVTVYRVENDRCFANVSLGWSLGELLEGDIAVPAAATLGPSAILIPPANPSDPQHG